MVNDCGILHRDISVGNILAVCTGPGPDGLHGLLIDLDSAIRTDGVERTARAERSGTLPYMSIANLENLDEDRTALDDWESLLYVVCWLATFGIRSEDRRSLDESLSISLWNTNEVDAAKAKRGHMDDSRIFEGKIVTAFQPRYELLEDFAIGLHQMLFQHPDCEGALFDPRENKKPSMLGLKKKNPLPKVDPLVRRSKHVDTIINNLMGFLAEAENVAKDRFNK
ncbi:hypothetical protein IWW36_002235 [Coemansia brasiliensis]|uniref:Fungal-type protein kinase domain-containing protein n=1 Tax=Coemansia brasiliensis TaxID=2650707 RepID=A0A9W8IGA8_9FUNG|nr:hypothetical protein IWW36_002235 [Coemansia brasiliensis]